MNDLFTELLKVSLGVVVGGAFSTPFRVLKAYNTTQLSISTLDQKIENLSDLLQHWERGFVESKLRSEKIEQAISELDRRLGRAEFALEFFFGNDKESE